MGKDLQLTISNRYSVVAMIFFVGYALIDLPSPLAMKYVPAPLLIPSIGVAFGVITLGQGFIHHWGELAACRALLGLVEGALLPTSVLLLQVWYTRFEFQKRIALYYMVVIASSGLSGLLAYGIVKMDGTSGLEGWRWIFILEGVASCAVALVAFWALIDLPHRATQKSFFGRKAFLTQEEAVAHMAHIQRDRGDAETVNYGWRDMLYHMRELNVWEFSLILMFNVSRNIVKICCNCGLTPNYRTLHSMHSTSSYRSSCDRGSATRLAEQIFLPFHLLLLLSRYSGF